MPWYELLLLMVVVVPVLDLAVPVVVLPPSLDLGRSKGEMKVGKSLPLLPGEDNDGGSLITSAARRERN